MPAYGYGRAARSCAQNRCTKFFRTGPVFFSAFLFTIIKKSCIIYVVYHDSGG